MDMKTKPNTFGNPGKEYKLHRHNVGFMAIDSLLEFYNIKIDSLGGFCKKKASHVPARSR